MPSISAPGSRGESSPTVEEERSSRSPCSLKETDVNSTFGAWWVPLRRMVKELGKEVVEQKLEDLDNEIKQLRMQTFDDANVDSSSDEE